MATATIRVIARITAQAGKIGEMKSILQDLVGPTLRDDGCISYQLLQNINDLADFTFVEEWASEAAIAAHMATPHIQMALSQVQSLLADEPDIRLYAIVA